MRVRALLLAAAVLPATGLAAAEPGRAEYAVRWDPADGGPASAAELLSFLGASNAEGRRYEVRYFDFPAPAGAPAGAAPILRQRVAQDGEAEIRLKYRSAQPLSGAWACPEGAGFRKSEETDVTFAASGPERSFAYSCSLDAASPPALLAATPKTCSARMVRYEHGGDKIEEWTLPGGGVRLEVSRTGSDDAKHAAKFGKLVDRLRARGVKPLDESKTELASRCPSAKP